MSMPSPSLSRAPPRSAPAATRRSYRRTDPRVIHAWESQSCTSSRSPCGRRRKLCDPAPPAPQIAGHHPTHRVPPAGQHPSVVGAQNSISLGLVVIIGAVDPVEISRLCRSDGISRMWTAGGRSLSRTMDGVDGQMLSTAISPQWECLPTRHPAFRTAGSQQINIEAAAVTRRCGHAIHRVIPSCGARRRESDGFLHTDVENPVDNCRERCDSCGRRHTRAAGSVPCSLRSPVA